MQSGHSGEGKRHTHAEIALRVADQAADRVFGFADILQDAPGVPLQQQAGVGAPANSLSSAPPAPPRLPFLDGRARG